MEAVAEVAQQPTQQAALCQLSGSRQALFHCNFGVDVEVCIGCACGHSAEMFVSADSVVTASM